MYNQNALNDSINLFRIQVYLSITGHVFRILYTRILTDFYSLIKAPKHIIKHITNVLRNPAAFHSARAHALVFATRLSATRCLCGVVSHLLNARNSLCDDLFMFYTLGPKQIAHSRIEVYIEKNKCESSYWH